jgi:hypothetical protein
MINGAHAIPYSHGADATRATLAKVLRTLPGGVELGLYQPRHPTAAQPSPSATNSADLNGFGSRVDRA